MLGVQVKNRRDAELYCQVPHEGKSIFISISDPRMRYDSEGPFISDSNGVIDILRLCFADADRPGLDVYGNMADGSDLMSEEDADAVARFIEQYYDDDVMVFVHCDAGISRSAGVAAAILYFLTGDDSEIFDSGRYRPNMWCYRKVLNAFL